MVGGNGVRWVLAMLMTLVVVTATHAGLSITSEVKAISLDREITVKGITFKKAYWEEDRKTGEITAFAGDIEFYSPAYWKVVKSEIRDIDNLRATEDYKEWLR